MGWGQSKEIAPVLDAESLDWKEKIGKGGFGDVYHARHRQFGWDLAVKLLCSDDGTFSKKDLIDEALLMRHRAENPYVMKVMGFFKGNIPGEATQKVGIVMELMDNGSISSLQEKLNRTPPWPLVFRLAHQVALGMNYLHSLNPAILHKDLKAQNILLDTGLNAKITDCGLARFVFQTRTAPNVFYAPPEFSQFLPGGATCAYDVYSYGMLLWSILNTGQKTFPFNVRAGKRPPLEYINGLQADGLEELVELMKRCWSQKKEDRPSFTECTAVTQTLYEMHRDGINRAVFQVQTELKEQGLLSMSQFHQSLQEAQTDRTF